MKTNKLNTLLMIFLLSAGSIAAQEYKTSVQNTKDGKLVLSNFPNDLPIEGYSGSEIIISSSGGDFEPPERAKGLKPIFPGGNDNSGLGLNVEKDGNTISITCLLPITRAADYEIKVPDNLSLEISSGCERSSNISVTGMKNEIEIQSCHDIDLKNVTGPLVLSSISGDININFGANVPDKPISINVVSGEIDITLPAKTPASLDLRTVGGSFYSDFDFTQSKENMKKVVASQLSYALNGGGPKISIATVSGNVYIRKGN
jgi:hypothetical protein